LTIPNVIFRVESYQLEFVDESRERELVACDILVRDVKPVTPGSAYFKIPPRQFLLISECSSKYEDELESYSFKRLEMTSERCSTFKTA
jgi:hypothetical protein